MESDKKFLVLDVQRALGKSYSNYCFVSEQSSNYREDPEMDLVAVRRKS